MCAPAHSHVQSFESPCDLRYGGLSQGVALQLRLIFSLYIGPAAVLLDDKGP